MKSHHTPGPWKIDSREESDFIFIQDRASIDLAKLPKMDESEANARLMAEAPDLLSLVRAYATTYPLDEYRDKARAAIAKAEGRA